MKNEDENLAKSIQTLDFRITWIEGIITGVLAYLVAFNVDSVFIFFSNDILEFLVLSALLSLAYEFSIALRANIREYGLNISKIFIQLYKDWKQKSLLDKIVLILGLPAYILSVVAVLNLFI